MTKFVINKDSNVIQISWEQSGLWSDRSHTVNLLTVKEPQKWQEQSNQNTTVILKKGRMKWITRN